jgi:multiple sugar transport system permease protein
MSDLMQMLKPKTKAQSTTLFAWALIAPAAIYMFLIVVWPLVETFRLSFTNSNIGTLMEGHDYIGWANYEKALGGRKFPAIVTRTFYWMFLSVGLKMILGLIGATLLASNIRARGVIRALVMPPWIIPIAIGCFGWLWLYNGHFGLLSNFVEMIGITDGPFSFLAYKKSAFYSAVVTDVWIGTPMVTLFFLAAMQGVPRDLYEAAYVDGASRWYRFRRITMPQIMPTVITMALLSAIWTFNSFEIIWILTEGGPRGATTTLIIDTFKTAIFSYKFDAGATRAVLVVLILGVFSVIYLTVLGRLSRKYGYSGVQK